MSDLFRGLVQGFGHEADRLRTAIEDASALTFPAYAAEDLEMPGAPSLANKIDARNQIADPVGQSADWLTRWSVQNGDIKQETIGDLPRWPYAVKGIAAGVGDLSLRAQTEESLSSSHVYAYCLAKVDEPATGARARLVRVDDDTVLDEQVFVGRMSTWWLVRLDAPLGGSGSAVRLVLRINSPSAGWTAHMTGATIARQTDPGEPLSGDLLPTDNYAYEWQGARFASKTLRHGPRFDMLKLLEHEHDFSVAPMGMSMAQRQAYILARWQARRKSWGSTFHELIVKLIQSEDPLFSPANVRVIRNAPDRSFRVEIAYSETGVLAERVKQLITSIKRAGLKLDPETDIVWGTFRAGINAAGDPV